MSDEGQESGVGSQESGEGQGATQGSGEDLAARIAELEGELARVTAELTAANEAVEAASRRGLDHYRRALLAAHAGEIVEELVQGATEEALDASVALAQQAHGRIAELVRQRLGAASVPAGAAERLADQGEGLSPLARIAQGLKGR